MVCDLVDFAFGDVKGVDAADAAALFVYLVHDVFGFGEVFVEVAHQDVHDEVHRGVVVIQEDDFVLARLAQFGVGSKGFGVGVKIVLRAHGNVFGLQAQEWRRHGFFQEGRRREC